MTNEELTTRVITLDSKITAQGEQIKTLFSVTKNIETMNKTLIELSTQFKSMNTKLDKACGDIEKVKGRDGERWETVIRVVITAVVGGLVGSIITLILK